MKLKLIKDSEVVVDRLEYGYLKSSVDIIKLIDSSVRNKTALYRIFYYEDMCEVAVAGGKGCMAIKRFDTDDQEHNRACAEELVELLNQK